MSYSINLGSLLGSTLAIVLGLYALRIAWLAIHLKRNVVSPMDRIAVQLQRILGRSEAAARLEDELRSPRYVSRTGWQAAVVGIILVIGGILVIAGVVLSLPNPAPVVP